MFYVVKSNTKSMRDKIVESLIKQNNISQEDIYVFDYDEIKTIEPAFLEYLTLDFEGKTKFVLIKNADFINAARVDQQLENRFASAVLLNNKNIIVLTVDKLNKTGMLRKRFENDMTFLEKDGPDAKEMSSFINDYFSSRGISISAREIEMIKSKSSGDFDLLISELSKLEVLQSDNVITEEHIDKAILDFSRERLYKIAEYVITLNDVKVASMFKQYRAEGEGPYLIGEFMVKDFSRLISYKAMRNKGFNDGQIKDMTDWSPWAIKNYNNWSSYWKDINILKEFFYEVILKKCFLDIVKHNPEDALGTMEKMLIANIIGTKAKI